MSKGKNKNTKNHSAVSLEFFPVESEYRILASLTKGERLRQNVGLDEYFKEYDEDSNVVAGEQVIMESPFLSIGVKEEVRPQGNEYYITYFIKSCYVDNDKLNERARMLSDFTENIHETLPEQGLLSVEKIVEKYNQSHSSDEHFEATNSDLHPLKDKATGAEYIIDRDKIVEGARKFVVKTDLILPLSHVCTPQFREIFPCLNEEAKKQPFAIWERKLVGQIYEAISELAERNSAIRNPSYQGFLRCFIHNCVLQSVIDNTDKLAEIMPKSEIEDFDVNSLSMEFVKMSFNGLLDTLKHDDTGEEDEYRKFLQWLKNTKNKKQIVDIFDKIMGQNFNHEKGRKEIETYGEKYSFVELLDYVVKFEDVTFVEEWEKISDRNAGAVLVSVKFPSQKGNEISDLREFTKSCHSRLKALTANQDKVTSEELPSSSNTLSSIQLLPTHPANSPGKRKTNQSEARKLSDAKRFKSTLKTEEEMRKEEAKVDVDEVEVNGVIEIIKSSDQSWSRS